MMPINPEIALQARAAPVENPVDQYAKVLGMQQAVNSSRLANLQIRSMETQMGRDERIRSKLAQLGPGAGIDQISNAYLSEGDAATGAKLAQNQAAIAASQASTEKNKEATIGERAKNTAAAMDEFGQTMVGVKDEAGHQAALQRLTLSPNQYTRDLATRYGQQHPSYDKASLDAVLQGTAAQRAAVEEHLKGIGKTEPYPADVQAQRVAERQAGATVNNMGAPVAGVDAQGNPVFFQPDKGGGTPSIVPGVRPPPKAQLTTAKDINTAKGKIMAAENLKRQIAIAREKFTTASKDTATTGIVGGYNPLSESGQSFDASIDALRGSVTALTRVPGIGSMSDWEGRIDQAKLPKRSQYDSVTTQKLDELEALADGVISGYSDMLGPQQPPAPPTVTTPDGTQVDSMRPPAPKANPTVSNW